MGGTRAGGLKAAEKNKRNHGNSFYKVIGAKGGKIGTSGGFAYQGEHMGCKLLKRRHRLAECAGAAGGRKSRRKKMVKS